MRQLQHPTGVPQGLLQRIVAIQPRPGRVRRLLVFQRGTLASAIYGVRRGIVELQGNEGDKTCYRPGELFSFRDIVWHQGLHHSDAVALTPVEVIRLDRLRFLNLVHNHPTLAILLIGQQHERLREQRTSGTCCY